MLSTCTGVDGSAPHLIEHRALPAPLYGPDTWTLSTRDRQRIHAFRMRRPILGTVSSGLTISIKGHHRSAPLWLRDVGNLILEVAGRRHFLLDHACPPLSPCSCVSGPPPRCLSPSWPASVTGGCKMAQAIVSLSQSSQATARLTVTPACVASNPGACSNRGLRLKLRLRVIWLLLVKVSQV